MSLLYVFRVAYRNIYINKRRSLLTMLGIIIGMMSVVLVMSVGSGAQSLILNQVAKRGTDQIAVLAGASDPNGPPASALGITITTLTHDDARALLEEQPAQNIKQVAAYISGNDVAQFANQEEAITYTGTTASYEQVEKITMKYGRFFTPFEEEQRAAVLVLGSNIANDLFGNQNPVGSYIKVKKKRFEVVGVMEEQGSSAFENPDDSVLIPLTVVQEQLKGVDYVSFIRLQVHDETRIDQTVEEIRQILIDRHGDEDFSVRTIADALVILSTITGAMTFFLVAVAGVALFVGGVGIMNIMLIAVKEKTREIGLRKAIGATNRDILFQFLIETCLLSFVGTGIGIILGVIISFIISVVVQSLGYAYDFIIPIAVMFIGVFVSLGIGVLFGIIPAKKAAELHPIDALRYE